MIVVIASTICGAVSSPELYKAGGSVEIDVHDLLGIAENRNIRIVRGDDGLRALRANGNCFHERAHNERIIEMVLGLIENDHAFGVI